MADGGYKVVLKEQRVTQVTLTTANIGLVLIPYHDSRLARPGRVVRFFINKNLSKTAEVMGDGSVSTILEDVPLIPPPIISVDVDGTPIKDQLLEVNLPYPKPKMIIRRGEMSGEKGKWEVEMKVEVHDEKGYGVEADYGYEVVWDGNFVDGGRKTDKDDDGRDTFSMVMPKGFRQAKVRVKLDKIDCERELVIKEPVEPLPDMSPKDKKRLWIGSVVFLAVILFSVFVLPYVLGR